MVAIAVVAIALFVAVVRDEIADISRHNKESAA
jgi:hypothetical protein